MHALVTSSISSLSAGVFKECNKQETLWFGLHLPSGLNLATPIFTLPHIYTEPLSFSKPAVLSYHSTILLFLSLPLFLYQTEMEQHAFFLLMKG